MFSVSTAISEIQQELNLIGQQVDNSDIMLYLTRAVMYFSTTYAFPTAKKHQDLTIFRGVREYGLASDFATLIEPERSPALPSPHFMHTTERELAHWPFGKQTAIEYDGDTPFLVANEDSGLWFQIAGCDDTTGVTISGDSSSIALDNIIYTEGTGSLRFTVAASGGTTTITFAVSSFDITDFLTKAFAFLDLGCPSTNTANISNIKLRIGNDASNYYEMSATTRFRGQSIGTGFGLIGFDPSTKTTTGTVTDTAIDFVQVVISHGLTGVNGVYHLDNIFLAQGVFYQIPYYSKNNIQDENGIAKETITSTGDNILLPRNCYEAITYKTLELIASSPNVANQSFANYAARELKAKEDTLRSVYPYQRSLIRSKWYKRTEFKKRTRRF